MGNVDKVTKAYMRENAIFADAFNYLIYDGRQVIKPDDLQELDTSEVVLPFSLEHGQEDRKKDAVQRYRDVLKQMIIKEDGQAAYVLLGIENQAKVHYAMPVRSMIYDALQYGIQVSDAVNSQKNRKSKQRKNSVTERQKDGAVGQRNDGTPDQGKSTVEHRKKNAAVLKLSDDEFLSGFRKGEHIRPVITLVIHFGTKKWDGPLSLYDMMGIENASLKPFMQDYKINLIDVAALTKEDLLKFSTSLREVFGYIRYSRNKNELKDFITDNPRMTLEVSAARVIQAVTRTALEVEDDAEVVDMCKAIEEMMEDSRNEGRAEGEAKGKAEGIVEGEAKGRAEGEAKGKAEGKLATLADLVRDGLLPLREAARRADMSEAEFEAATASL